MAARSRANRADFPIGTAYGIFCLESIDPFLQPPYARNWLIPRHSQLVPNLPAGAGRGAEPVPVTERLALIEAPGRPQAPSQSQSQSAFPTSYSNQEPKKKRSRNDCRERPLPHLKFRTRSLSALSLASWRYNDTPQKIEA